MWISQFVFSRSLAAFGMAPVNRTSDLTPNGTLKT